MSATKSLTFAQRIHFPTAMTLGILGVVLFVIGDGIEAVWITDFFHSELGFTVSQASLVYTSYGVVVAVAAFLSGALCDAISPRKVMLVGLVSFLLFDFLFITVAIPSKSLPLLVLIYGLRGFGYPMLAYGFLTWMMIVTVPERQSSASGWFWFAFSLGMQTIGSYLSSLFVPSLGGIATLWIGLALAALGGWVTMYFLRSQPSARASKHISVVDSLFSGLSITWRRPKVGGHGDRQDHQSCRTVRHAGLLFGVRAAGAPHGPWQGDLGIYNFWGSCYCRRCAVGDRRRQVGLAPHPAVDCYPVVGCFARIPVFDPKPCRPELLADRFGNGGHRHRPVCSRAHHAADHGARWIRKGLIFGNIKPGGRAGSLRRSGCGNPAGRQCGLRGRGLRPRRPIRSIVRYFAGTEASGRRSVPAKQFRKLRNSPK
ncbi:alpha-ketoglutarate permease domain protein [Winkia neuii]|nr:alpha-ketoglutarate permease domain protein [Winkia neuii]